MEEPFANQGSEQPRGGACELLTTWVIAAKSPGVTALWEERNLPGPSRLGRGLRHHRLGSDGGDTLREPDRLTCR